MGQYSPLCPNKVMELSLYTLFVLSVLECETGTQSCGQNHGFCYWMEFSHVLSELTMVSL